MNEPRSNYGYSSKVKLTLIVGGIEIPLAQVCPDGCIAQEPIDLPESSMATLVITVDGRVKKEEVLLPHGAHREVEKILFV